MAYEQGWNKSTKTRHISVKYSFIIEQIQNGIIKPVYVQSDQMRADMLTKPITGNKFKDYYQDSMQRKTDFTLLASQGLWSHPIDENVLEDPTQIDSLSQGCVVPLDSYAATQVGR